MFSVEKVIQNFLWCIARHICDSEIVGCEVEGKGSNLRCKVLILVRVIKREKNQCKL